MEPEESSIIALVELAALTDKPVPGPVAEEAAKELLPLY